MLALRLFLALIGILLVISLLGYAINRDPRWLRLAGLGFKGGVALVVLLMLIYVTERLILVL
ncbi:MAG: hypothetical protein FJ209_02555 [Betaproteobacteria bacterium]|jgi:hypothetical protein|nr:hypothetical protein [Betaproteobacteria bacterium]MCU0933298.1 hypothetical protein [Thiobacillaceae bacterium]